MSDIIKKQDNEFIIPVNITAQKGLSGTDKMILGMVFTAIYNKELFTHSNKKIAHDTGVTKSAVSKSISKLKKLGHVRTIKHDSPIYSGALRRIQMSSKLYGECFNK